ncbi:NADH-quinone oxidoreductase subunit N [Riemerella anatipestifer]|uniref:NADH-quinone oxidoreductase subunit N n=1 Tax=Riemerella anatipestifer TaxID=34085 RepID=A0AAP6LLE4_RIEAN|nr:NADH-quinone oxidoreductase subunit N [Riemerella anatipestifer]MBT0549804.1 NADH-quinone oxidoreductase subunit N [Riemerella anatipestifer]MBT0556045.1 NADH-quinone oxidoreductase subunit N [Riemerella anatipestifer]MBT0560567.1 NADH-quinone oxidoreductase subunit N [Riemerella anatipestifer]MCD5968850.1 NADH-quinone oxidoreductase subunit N [Riemerella anatipestifer]MCO7354522.1 NADH-quinone oxidoreductase subunit N [Riemerella anatipestifer]
MSVLITIFITAVIALFTGVFNQGKYARYVGILGLGIALYVSFLPDCTFFEKYNAMFSYSANTALFTKISLVVTLLLFFIAGFAFSNHRSHQSELYALMLFSLCGGIILFGFQNMVTLFLGIEILSIPLYVMAGSAKTNLRSVEASMKYFLMGAFATGFLLFGIALIYGSTGSFDLATILLFGGAHGATSKMFLLGIVMMLVAMAFKVSLAPFHMWSPDVYQGAPSIITGFMASVVKIAGFYAFFKVMTLAFIGGFSTWINIVAVLIILTLILSNIMGLAQTNAKRMLAYSSVSHAGYIALIFFGFSSLSAYNLAFYLFAYSLATVGVFMCLIWVEKIKRETSFEAFNGLAKTEPLLAVVASVSLLSMAGIPLTAGFIGKFNVFSQAISGNATVLVIVAILGSALSIAYYLRLIIAMFFYQESSFKTSEKVSITYNIMAVVLVLLLVAMGVYPDLFAMQFGLY